PSSMVVVVDGTRSDWNRTAPYCPKLTAKRLISAAGSRGEPLNSDNQLARLVQSALGESLSGVELRPPILDAVSPDAARASSARRGWPEQLALQRRRLCPGSH